MWELDPGLQGGPAAVGLLGFHSLCDAGSFEAAGSGLAAGGSHVFSPEPVLVPSWRCRLAIAAVLQWWVISTHVFMNGRGARSTCANCPRLGVYGIGAHAMTQKNLRPVFAASCCREAEGLGALVFWN